MELAILEARRKTLEQWIPYIKELGPSIDGPWGLNACYQSVREQQEIEGCSLYVLLERYVDRANEDIFFNYTMILACWNLINGRA